MDLVYALIGEKDRETYKTVYRADRSRAYPIRLFVQGHGYRLFGLIPMQVHLFGTGVEGVPVHLFGAMLWAATCSRAPCTERRFHCRSGWWEWPSASSSAS